MPKSPKCVLHPDRAAITTAAQILVCKECDERYREEGQRYLPIDRRFFYQALREADGLKRIGASHLNGL